jgi:putative two-component system response regulator
MAELLLVENDEVSLRWALRILREQAYGCECVSDAEGARLALASGRFDLVLVDTNLPGESGLELLAALRAEHSDIAVVMVSGDDDLALAAAAIELGVHGYLVKPVRPGELLISVAVALHRRRREAELTRLQTLKDSPGPVAHELRGAIEASKRAADVAQALQSDEMRRLVRLAEFRDDQTGQHMLRVGRYCELIAVQLGWPHERCESLRVASELHDVGKVAIPDRILRKPGKLTPAEVDVMRTHAKVGYELLADADADVMRLAATIALSHHERWDGSGYPHGLCGSAISEEGRVVAIADVFDALTSDRVYRPAFPIGIALDMMTAERGGHFDPEPLDAMVAVFDEIEGVRRIYGD